MEIRIEKIKANSGCLCRGNCGQLHKTGWRDNTRLKKGNHALKIKIWCNKGVAESWYCIDCAKNIILPEILQCMTEFEIITSEDKNVALLNCKHENDVVKEHCVGILKGKK